MERQATPKENLEISFQIKCCYLIVAQFEINYINAIDVRKPKDTCQKFSIYSVFAVQPIEEFYLLQLVET